MLEFTWKITKSLHRLLDRCAGDSVCGWGCHVISRLCLLAYGFAISHCLCGRPGEARVARSRFGLPVALRASFGRRFRHFIWYDSCVWLLYMCIGGRDLGCFLLDYLIQFTTSRWQSVYAAVMVVTKKGSLHLTVQASRRLLSADKCSRQACNLIPYRTLCSQKGSDVAMIMQ